MPKFAANLSMMFNEHDFLDRFNAAAEWGFDAVEYLFPYDFAPDVLAQRLADNQLKQALFNLPPGSWDKGERGLSALPGREQEFKESVDIGLEYAKALGNDRVHMMAGLIPDDVPVEKAFETYVENFKYCADKFAEIGLEVIVEPLNTTDAPGYLISQNVGARTAILATERDNVGLQFDFYHVQIMSGNLATQFKDHFDITKHIQISGVPGRHEPNVGEINYPYLFDLIDEMGYQGYVGCEYKPQGDTVAGLTWLSDYQNSKK